MSHLAVHLKLTQHCKSTILQYKTNFRNKNTIRVLVECKEVV